MIGVFAGSVLLLLYRRGFFSSFINKPFEAELEEEREAIWKSVIMQFEIHSVCVLCVRGCPF